jgi:quercetin dioxygenase-like cupin family protein
MNPIIFSTMLLSIMFYGSTRDHIESAVYSWKDLKVNKQETRTSRPILEGSTTHLEYFEIHATTLYPGKMPHSSHTHNSDDELILVREGQIRLTTENTSKTIGPGGIAVIQPGEEHDMENAGNKEAIYYILKMRSKVPMDVNRSIDAGGSMFIDRKDLDFKTHKKGGRWNYFDRPTTACEDFEFHATSLNPKTSSHAPHTHVQEEIILMLTGNAVMHIDGQEYNVETGDVIFLDSNIPHNISNIGDVSCEYFAFQWK